MKSVGLDIATHTGMAMVGQEEDRGKVIYLPDQKGFLRLQLIAGQVEQTLLVWKPDLVVLEGYAYTKNISSFVTLVEIGTMIRAVLHTLKLRWCVVPPTTLKKWTTGAGNASKEAMATAVKARWGYASHSQDIVDAYALAQMGQLGTEELRAIRGVTF